MDIKSLLFTFCLILLSYIGHKYSIFYALLAFTGVNEIVMYWTPFPPIYYQRVDITRPDLANAALKHIDTLPLENKISMLRETKAILNDPCY